MVSDEKIAELDAGKRPAVLVKVTGYEYRNTVAVMGGRHLISVSAAIRKETGLRGGDPIQVTLTLADSPRTVDIPTDFAGALVNSGRTVTCGGDQEVNGNTIERPEGSRSSAPRTRTFTSLDNAHASYRGLGVTHVNIDRRSGHCARSR